MKNTEQSAVKTKRLKIAIIILSILLVLSLGGLAARFIYLEYFARAQETVAVPDNLIGEEPSTVPDSLPSEDGPAADEEETEKPGTSSDESALPPDDSTAIKLELFENKPGDNHPFEVKNMFPGDTEIKYFCIQVHHDEDIELFFRADITEQTKKLGNALNIKVTDLNSGESLLDAPFSEINGKELSTLLKSNGDNLSTVYYKIEATLDTSVGNEYQAAELKASFKWFVEAEDSLTPPLTDGASIGTALWATLAASAILLIVLLVIRRRKGAGQNE